jgi:hypothetical protein
LSAERNEELPKIVDSFPGLKDFYNEYDPYKVSEADRKAFQKYLESLDDDEQKLLRRKTNFYLIEFTNDGGLVMPIVFRLHFADGSEETMTLPAEIWRRNSEQVSKMVMTDKLLERVELDPRGQLADTDASNNSWPPVLKPTRFELYKSSGRGGGSNPMKAAMQEEKKAAEEAAKKQAAEAKAKAEAETKAEEKDEAADDAEADAEGKKSDAKKAEGKKSDAKKADAKKTDAKQPAKKKSAKKPAAEDKAAA